MPDILPASYIAAKNDMHSIAPWAWLFEVDLDGTNGMRVCGYDAPIIYNANTYSPFPVVLTGVVREDSGALPQPEFIVSNVTREIATYLEAGGVIDRNCRVRLINTSDTGNVHDWGQYRIRNGTVTLQAARFTLGIGNLFDAPFPAVRVTRGRCPYIYGDSECQYDTSLPNLIAASRPSFDPTTCDLTLEGGNGCRAHGENEAANGAAVLHVLRYGGLPSVPRGPARVA